MNTLTLDRLRAALRYDPDVGRFTWIAPTTVWQKPGNPAGTLHGSGYRFVSIDKRTYAEHRLAWFYVHGLWPIDQIDHINGNKTDNRLSNLRQLSNTLNSQNVSKGRSSSTTGFLGVKRSTYGFCAAITVSGVTKYLGSFRTPEQAHEAYMVAKRALHPSAVTGVLA